MNNLYRKKKNRPKPLDLGHAQFKLDPFHSPSNPTKLPRAMGFAHTGICKTILIMFPFFAFQRNLCKYLLIHPRHNIFQATAQMSFEDNKSSWICQWV